MTPSDARCVERKATANGDQNEGKAIPSRLWRGASVIGPTADYVRRMSSCGRECAIGRLAGSAKPSLLSHHMPGEDLSLIDDVVVGMATPATLPVPGRAPADHGQTAFPKGRVVRFAFRVLHFNVQCE
jgi:hypothetical protein